MNLKKNSLFQFEKVEFFLWLSSVFVIVAVFLIFDRESYFNFSASLIGVTALIYSAKGHPFGQALMVVFGLQYGAISFGFGYYGEMLTYVGMTVPMAIFSFICWLKHPFEGQKSQVQVGFLTPKTVSFMAVSAVFVTVIFYFILRYFHTANLFPSTVSVTTSFLAVFLTAKRSRYFALAYAANDMVLMVLWGLAAIKNIQYISVLFCFSVFLVNDIYTFFSWSKLQKQQLLKTGKA